jgi:hypothetical protein
MVGTKSILNTYGHSQLKTGHPVRSAIHKQISTTVGDHVGIPAAICFVLARFFFLSSSLVWIESSNARLNRFESSEAGMANVIESGVAISSS